MTISIVQSLYRSSWPDEFFRFARHLVEHRGPELVAIHHIGSTAVEGLASKDVIDIQFDRSKAQQS